MKLFAHIFFGLFQPWTWITAWRDGRSHWGRMLLYTSSIVIGVAALVAIRSFGANAAQSIAAQAKSLLGADLVIQSRQKLSDEVKAYLKTIPGERSEQQASITMAFIPKSSATRMIQSRTSQPGFPWYGEVITEPRGAHEKMQREKRGALVEEAMMKELDLSIGDQILVNGVSHPIIAELKEMPGESGLVSQLAPRVITPIVEKSTLALPFMTTRSMGFTQISFKYPSGFDDTKIVETLKELRRKHTFRFNTVETRTERMGSRLSNLFSFLGLVGFVALLLGGIGVAGSIHLYVRRKLPAVAMLRCVGAKAHQTIAIYVLQALWMGLVGGVVGALLGTLMQVALGHVFDGLLPFTVGFRVSWSSVGIGVLTGIVVTFLFGLLPLLNVRRVSPLMTLRADLEPVPSRDPMRWLVYAIIALFIVGFAIMNTPKAIHGIMFSLALFVASAALYGVAVALVWGLKRAPIGSFPFSVRQGLKNLHRPRNQTKTLTLCLGLGVFLIMSQYLADKQLVRQIGTIDSDNRPNLVMFEVRDEQIDPIRAIMKENDAIVVDTFPVVKMTLHSVKGVGVDALREKLPEKRRGRTHKRWVYNREYKVTCRDRLNEAEHVIEGTFIPTVAEGEIPIISIERDYARRLGVLLGDDLAFACGDRVIECTVGSIRQVDWFRLQPTFFIVFPTGALTGLPKVNAMTARVSSAESTARVKSQTVQRFPNVWAVDMGTIVNTFNAIFEKVTFTVRFMALFSLCTGVMILLTSVRNTRDHRLKENALLRTLGASKRIIFIVMGVEYAMLGSLAAVAGNGMAVLASWAVTSLIFKVPYQMEWIAVGTATVAVTVITTVVGLVNSRSVTVTTPLEALRTIE